MSASSGIPAPGSKLSDAGKQYSKASSNALKRLDSVEKNIEGIVHRVEDVVSIARGPDANSDDVTQLLKSKNELVQIMGDLERLQFKGLDAVDTSELQSGKTEARNQRKSLNQTIDNLIRRTQQLHDDFVTTVEKIKTGKLRRSPDAPLTISNDDPASPSRSPIKSPRKSSNKKQPTEKVADLNKAPVITAPDDETGRDPIVTEPDEADISPVIREHKRPMGKIPGDSFGSQNDRPNESRNHRRKMKKQRDKLKASSLAVAVESSTTHGPDIEFVENNIGNLELNEDGNRDDIKPPRKRNRGRHSKKRQTNPENGGAVVEQI